MAFSTYIKSITSLFKKNENTIQGCLIVAATASLNQLIAASFFQCPKSAYHKYGWTFMVLPGLILAVLSLLASNSFTLGITGLCRKDEDVPEPAKLGKSKRFWGYFFKTLAFSLAYAVLAFTSWLTMSLLFTDAYSCAKIGAFNKKTQDKLSKDDYLAKKEKYDTDSRVIGLILLTAGLSGVFLMHLITKCCFSALPTKELSSMRKYDEVEAKAADKEFDVLMKKSAEATGKKMVKKFMDTFYKTENYEETEFERKAIADLRKFLALRYPRLDMIGQTWGRYCIPELVPAKFHVDKVEVEGEANDNTPLCATSNL
ncbi:uncharacterized protein LOC135683937 [Rhopilema esculentum]|uniref:uncharacterized protein LOC135683937 n=1 Tax=Rhopilema esculentum TaxID=499914 RepID=UPI0031DF9C37|eukprot:gene15753-7046_t